MHPLITVGTAPGFCNHRALATWNTSTTPFVLHLSMVVAIRIMAQNIPLQVTVSLQWTTMGLLPYLMSITSVTLFRLEQYMTIRFPACDIRLVVLAKGYEHNYYSFFLRCIPWQLCDHCALCTVHRLLLVCIV